VAHFAVVAGSVGIFLAGSPLVLLALPLFAERMLSSNFRVWETTYHYDAFLIPILTLAAVDGFSRLYPWLSRRFSRWRITPQRWAGAVVIGAVALCGWFPFRNLVLSPWHSSSREKAGAAAVAQIPAGASVQATNNLAPHVTAQTAQLTMLDHTLQGAEWVIADTANETFPFTDGKPKLHVGFTSRQQKLTKHQVLQTQRAQVLALQRQGYETMFKKEGYVVLRRGADERADRSQRGRKSSKILDIGQKA